MPDVPISILDLAWHPPETSAEESLRDTVEMARAAERSGYHRVWYAEHHNVATVASSATSVVIGHVAANTSTIRVGSGGILLPNHAPLVIAEQFGTLAALYPGRIDLGIGRAVGGNDATRAALRRTEAAGESFPRDIEELRGYLTGHSLVPGVQAVPRAAQPPSIYLLGSSLFGAQLAARLGLPYAFAAHFAPAPMHDALTTYREGFRPSDQLAEPYAIVSVNVFAADDTGAAQGQRTVGYRARARDLLALDGRGPFTDAEIDALLTAPEGAALAGMNHYTAVGTAAEVRDYLRDFAATTRADELMLLHSALDAADRLRSVRLTGAEMVVRSSP
ncbi:LLM class flavin-dependent oxidoreductase [Actinoplanes sp. TBRC 11911]|uniref:LLM class flavin-dependent oxidoreductase n=1 Tax=Actinoplanes sp. TBRC 11911 TaxID=2729386 RepID=UPI00145CD6FF|nr:LLM class flavin-dependent oxidoreductase [Actinoplanes sp. TBRC 11911]NMO53902.1 LLM class flavin-dependent oxidoreductase [Actinoplanes sp. TBRC 11911]